MSQKKKPTRSGNYEEWLVESLKNPKEAASYLDAALEDQDLSVFLLALKHVSQAHGGLLKLSKRTKLSRVNLYRILSKTGNPELRSLEQILDALGFRLAIEVKNQRKRAA